MKLNLDRKLTLMILGVSLSTLIVACIAFVSYDYVTFRKSMLRDISTLAGVIGFNSTAAILFDDPSSAGRILSGLKAKHEINSACLYREDGSLFAQFLKSKDQDLCPTDIQAEEAHFNSNHLDYFHSIEFDGRNVGTLFIESDMRELGQRIEWYLQVVFLAMVLSLILAFFLAAKLRRIISQPVLNLVKISERISKKHDYSIRATKENPDEIGQLAEAFNEMLGTIHSREQAQKNLEQQLLQAQKMEAIGTLAGGVAHEINNPLGIILGFAQSLKTDIKVGDPMETPLSFILKESLRCKELVQNLLVFSRSSKMENLEEIDLSGPAEEALSLVATQSRVKNIQLVKELEPNLPKVLANKNQIQQVLINLCTNAMDAMEKGGTITVRTGRTERNGQAWVILQVHDTGSGIPADMRDNIFEPFFTTKEVGKGTGLGLSLVYEIVKKHKGTVDVESDVGKGTTFTVSFPIEADQKIKAA